MRKDTLRKANIQSSLKKYKNCLVERLHASKCKEDSHRGPGVDFTKMVLNLGLVLGSFKGLPVIKNLRLVLS